MIKYSKIVSALFPGLLVVIFWACDPGLNTATGSDPTTCEGCHTNEAALKNNASENTSDGGGGG